MDRSRGLAVSGRLHFARAAALLLSACLAAACAKRAATSGKSFTIAVIPQGSTHEFLMGLYAGVASAGVPAVGVERTSPATSAIKAFVRGGLSTVDSIETSAGRLALVLELAGAGSGHFGVEPAATSGLLPPVTPLTVTTGG